jgi:hypothetical protein
MPRVVRRYEIYLPLFYWGRRTPWPGMSPTLCRIARLRPHTRWDHQELDDPGVSLGTLARQAMQSPQVVGSHLRSCTLGATSSIRSRRERCIKV